MARGEGEVDCKTVGFFFLKISKEIGKACRKNLTRAKRASLTRPKSESIFSVSPLVSLSVLSLVPDLLFDCSRVLEYEKIRTVLQSTFNHNPTDGSISPLSSQASANANCLIVKLSNCHGRCLVHFVNNQCVLIR